MASKIAEEIAMKISNKTHTVIPAKRSRGIDARAEGKKKTELQGAKTETKMKTKL